MWRPCIIARYSLLPIHNFLACSSMYFHVTGRGGTLCGGFLPTTYLPLWIKSTWDARSVNVNQTEDYLRLKEAIRILDPSRSICLIIFHFQDCCSYLRFRYRPYTRIEIHSPCCPFKNRHSHPGTFLHPFSIETSSNCRFQSNPAK